MSKDLNFLEKIDYFSNLEPAVLKDVQKSVHKKTFERGAVITFSGDSAENLFFVYKGVLKAYKTSINGREQIFSILRAGTTFNDIPFFDEDVSPFSITAMVPSTVFGISRSKMKKLMESYPVLSHNVARALAVRARAFAALVEELSFHTVIERLAKIVLDNSEREKGAKKPLTQGEMASIAGTVRETIGRSLGVLEEMGAIKVERNHIVIKDRTILEKLIC